MDLKSKSLTTDFNFWGMIYILAKYNDTRDVISVIVSVIVSIAKTHKVDLIGFINGFSVIASVIVSIVKSH